MDRFIRLARLDNLIKEAAKKSEDLAALRSIFMDKYRGERAAAGLAQQYYDRFIGKSDLNAPVLTRDTLPQPLPDTVKELISLLRDENTSKILEEIQSAYPDISLDGLSQQYLSWIHSRYISKEKREIHPIEESMVTLRKFREIQDKFKNDAELREKIISSGYRDISSIENLSVDEMERIISIDNSDLTVKVHGVEISEKEYLGKFGEWNLWLPHTKETSAKIAGYDPVTYEPDTVWCTARTRGSNLFYKYIGRENYPMFLFYIIKDNPVVKSDLNDSEEQKKLDNDWLSLGYVSDGPELTPDYSGEDGGMSVNRANKGLEEEDFYEILGNEFYKILSRIEDELEKFKVEGRRGTTYQSPGRAIVNKLAKDVVEFKREFWPKSKGEKKDFVNIILDSNPSDDVRREIFKFYYKYDKNIYLQMAREGKADGIGLDDLTRQALKEDISSASPTWNSKLFFSNLKLAIKLGMDELIKQQADLHLESNLLDFISLYEENKKNPTIIEITKKGLISLAKKDPFLYISRYYFLGNILDVGDVVMESLLSLAESRPDIYIKSMSNSKISGTIENSIIEITRVAIKNFAETYPGSYLASYMSWGKKLNMVNELNNIALNSLTNKSPQSYLSNYSKEAKKLGLDDQQKVELDKIALQGLAEKDPIDYLSFYLSKGVSLGLDSHIVALKKLVDMDPSLYLEKYTDIARQYNLEDLNGLALEKVRNLAAENPEMYIRPYYSACKKLNMVDRFDISILENFAIDSPNSFLLSYNKYFFIAKELLRKDLIINALTKLSETDSKAYLSDNSIIKISKELGLIDLIRSTLERFLAENNAFLYLKEHASLTRTLGFNDLNIRAMNMYISSPQYREDTYSIFKLITGLNDSDLNRESSESPEPRLDDVEGGASLANHLVKLTKALESIGMRKEASRVKHLLNIR